MASIRKLVGTLAAAAVLSGACSDTSPASDDGLDDLTTEQLLALKSEVLTGFDLSISATAPSAIQPGEPFVVEFTIEEVKYANFVQLEVTLPDEVSLTGASGCVELDDLVFCDVRTTVDPASPVEIALELMLEASGSSRSGDVLIIDALATDDWARGEDRFADRDENPENNMATLAIAIS